MSEPFGRFLCFKSSPEHKTPAPEKESIQTAWETPGVMTAPGRFADKVLGPKEAPRLPLLTRAQCLFRKRGLSTLIIRKAN